MLSTGRTVTTPFVEWAASLPAALQAIERRDFDGALLDTNLSGTTVYPVADVLASRRVPFVFVTGYGRTADSEKRFPRAPILKKPFDCTGLARLLEHEMAQHRRAERRPVV